MIQEFLLYSPLGRNTTSLKAGQNTLKAENFTQKGNKYQYSAKGVVSRNARTLIGGGGGGLLYLSSQEVPQ